jgi:hypothetical protein
MKSKIGVLVSSMDSDLPRWDDGSDQEQSRKDGGRDKLHPGWAGRDH